MSTLRELWQRRERPQPMSRRWCLAWVKRTLTFPALLRLLWRAARLRARGAHVGRLVIIERCRIEGPGRNLELGDGAFIGEGCELVLHERIAVGEQAVINRRVTLLTASHSLRDPEWSVRSAPIRIGARAWIATGAMLLPGVSIGRGAVAGAGAVVRADVPDDALAVGNPATIRPAARAPGLCYDTAHFPAPFAAWLGPRRPG